MDDRVLADSLIGKLGAVAGLPELALSDDGVCSLEFNGEHVLNIGFDERDATLLLFAKLPPVADGKLAAAFRLMLEANHFGSGTGGGVFSIAKGTSLPMLAQRLPVRQVDFPAFEERVTQFVGLVELWSQAFTDLNSGEDVETPSGTVGDFMRV